MKKRTALCLLLFSVIACSAEVRGQGNTQSTKPAQPAVRRDETQRKNIQAYVELIRKDVRRDKTQIMGAVMRLVPEDAAKFWPIYNEYDAELNKVNNQRSDNIQEYARTYTQMTDEKADELIKRALDYKRQRSDLLGKYYERVKEALDAVTAARFVQIEDQLLMLIDLQIASSLPVVGER